MTKDAGAVLVMSVGTGDHTSLEATLLAPLRKSIATDAWARVILLPSAMTEEYAKRLKNGMGPIDAAIRPLPPGAENDADRAYAHFDTVLAAVLQATPPHRIVVDFTRGTKAMSAALVLAGYGGYTYVLAAMGPPLVKWAVGALYLGFAGLLLSVLRHRLKARRNDRYKDVEI